MSKISTLIDRFHTSGIIPSIAGNTAIQVNAGLLRNGSTVQPSFVEAEKGMQVISTTNANLEDGYFAIWNPTSDEVTNINWRAEYQHPIEMQTEVITHAQEAIGDVPIPSGPWDFTGG